MDAKVFILASEYTPPSGWSAVPVFPTSNPQFVFVVMLDTPKKSKDYYYKYRHQKGGWKGTLYNTAGWTSVELAGKVIDKIGPILATKYIEVN